MTQMDPAQYIGKPLAQQLTESKFTLVAGTTDLYHFVQIKDDDIEPAIEATELYVRLNGNTLTGIYAPLRFYIDGSEEQITAFNAMPYNILGARAMPAQNNFMRPFTLLNITNGAINFTVKCDFLNVATDIRSI